METKETGGTSSKSDKSEDAPADASAAGKEAAKPEATEPKVAAAEDEHGAATEKAPQTGDAAHEASAEAGDAKPAEEKASGDAADAPDAEAKAADASEPAADAPKSKPPLVAQPRKPSSSGTFAGVAALVILLLGVLGAVFLARRNDAPRQGGDPKHQKGKPDKHDAIPWKVGMKTPVVVTVLPDDKDNLECISKDELEGKHCAFEAKDTPWSKGDNTDDKTLLRPYATTGKRRLIASGFWSQMKEPFPEKRFNAKCTFVIEGKLEKPQVRFRKTMEFKEVKEAWFAGTLTDCQIVGPPGHPAGSAAHAGSAAPPAHGSAAPSAAPAAK